MGTREHHYDLLGKLAVSVVLAIIALSPPEQKTFAQSETDTTIHIVSWGETVSSIAAKYGVSAEAIVARNHLAASDRIYAGQQLIIPNAPFRNSPETNDHSTHVVQPEENLFRISLMYGVSIEALMAANDLVDEDHVYAGQSLVIPQLSSGAANMAGNAVGGSAPSEHTVRPGETLSGISELYGVSMASVQTANDLLNPSHILVGQRLIIPGAANSVSPGYTPQQASITHLIQPGENLFGIASHYGISMWVIAQSNNITNPSLIYSGQHISIPISGALTPAAGTVEGSGKSIVVDISEQRTYLYENGAMIQAFVVSTGVPGQDTMRGSFHIQNKIPVAYATTWDLQMPYWLGFYWAGPLQNGFHALPILSSGARLWEGLLGRPASYGCVILSEEAAKWLYGWAEVGVPVLVQD